MIPTKIYADTVTHANVISNLSNAKLIGNTRNITEDVNSTVTIPQLGGQSRATLAYSLTNFVNLNHVISGPILSKMGLSTAEATSLGLKSSMTFAELQAFALAAYSSNISAFTGVYRQHLSVKLQANSNYSFGYNGTETLDQIVTSSTSGSKLIEALYS